VYAFLADALVVFHLAFIAFVVAGAWLLPRWPRLVGLHLPAVAWGAYVEFSGTICPLTPLENVLRERAGESGYEGGFIAHYILPLMYPAGLTPGMQLILGVVVVVLNAAAYAMWWRGCRRRGQSGRVA